MALAGPLQLARQQAFLKVQGDFATPCLNMGPYTVKQQDNTLHVFLYYKYQSPSEQDKPCIPVHTIYSQIIPLPIYGLAAGDYQYYLNGQYSGSFALSAVNELEASYESAGILID